MQVLITAIYLTMSEKINPQPALLGADPTRDEKSLSTVTVFTISPTFNLTFSMYVLLHLEKEGVMKSTINVSSSKFGVN